MSEKGNELRYNYIKMVLASHIIFEMQVELRGTSVFNGRSKNAAHVLKVESKHNVDRDIKEIYNRDDKTANTVIQSIEDVAKELSTLDTHRIGNLHHVLKQIKDENCMLIDRDYYEKLEKLKKEYNKLKNKG